MRNITRWSCLVVNHVSARFPVPLFVSLTAIGLVFFAMNDVSSQSFRQVARAQDPGVRAGAGVQERPSLA